MPLEEVGSTVNEFQVIGEDPDPSPFNINR
jgi:hypothetical protein